MKLEVGKTYTTRSNQLVDINGKVTIETAQCFIGSNEQVYYNDGVHYAGDPSYDLLYETCFPLAIPPNPKSPPKVKLEVGKSYNNVKGKRVTIQEKCTFFHKPDGQAVYFGDDYNQYREDGIHLLTKDLDLIEEVPNSTIKETAKTKVWLQLP